MATRGDNWIITREPRPEATLRLLCFHHAGAGASTFRHWGSLLLPEIELVAVQLPGRENRYAEPALRSADAVLDALLPALGGRLGPRYALFGHSLGATLAYLFACRVRLSRELPMPVHLFASAAPAPTAEELTRRRERDQRPVTEDQLVEQLRKLGGTPPVILENRKLLRAFLATLVADMEILASISKLDEPPLPLPITCLSGEDDMVVPPQEAGNWSQMSALASDHHVLKGGHFFVQTAKDQVIAIINRSLQRVARSDARIIKGPD